MNISIIISTWNNSKRLSSTLESLTQCRIPKDLTWELVLVNNNCTDDTDHVVSQFQNRLPVKYVKEPRQGISIARNTGLDNVSGELIIFTDDDVKPCVEWVELFWQTYKEKGGGFFFGGPVESEFESIKPDEEFLELTPYSVKGLYWGKESRILKEGEDFIAANWACTKEALKDTGGFNPDLGLNPSNKKVKTGEETDLMDKLKKNGLKSWYVANLNIKHLVPPEKCNFKHVLERGYGFGYASAFNEKYRFDIGLKEARVPRWLYRQLLEQYGDWINAKLQRKKTYKHQIKISVTRGLIYGLKDLMRNKSNLK